MSAAIFLKIPAEERVNIFNHISADTLMPPFAVEKDWWVVQTLAIIFEMQIAKQLVFKGGTSLSKAWKQIERISEDIDLAIDRDFFGFTSDLGKSQRDKLRKTCGEYVDKVFFLELKAQFEAKGFINIKYEKNPPSFDEIIDDLTVLKNKINALPWKLQKEYPIPNSQLK